MQSIKKGHDRSPKKRKEEDTETIEFFEELGEKADRILSLMVIDPLSQ